MIRANGGVSRITTGWGLRRKLADRFREGRYDLVHIQNGLAPTFGVVGPLAARQVGIPVVATFHSWFPRSAGYRIFRRGFQWLLDRHAATIAVSEPVVWAMSRYLKANWEVIPNGVDTAFFQPIGRHPKDLATRAPRLLFLARLSLRLFRASGFRGSLAADRGAAFRLGRRFRFGPRPPAPTTRL